MSMTLAESMAMAVLKGDMIAAYALADKLIEEKDEHLTKMSQAAAATRNSRIASDGFEVYQWPEFKAFCKRAGILWDLRTVRLIITIGEGEPLRIIQEHLGSSGGGQ